MKPESPGRPSTRPLVLIGADVDPRLPGLRRPSWDPWDPIDLIPALEAACGGDFPKITWLIRADDTIRHFTGTFVSGFTTRAALWERLQARGHELGWHFHHWTIDEASSRFDADPSWVADAWEALSRCYPVRATRIGWDYCNAATLRKLDECGVQVDFSALPGHLVWWRLCGQRFVVDWRRCPGVPYHPDALDYQRSGPHALRLLEVPIASFPAGMLQAGRRIGWRLAHGAPSVAGVRASTRAMTASWAAIPAAADVLAFYFHPEDLTMEGVHRFSENLAALRERFDPEFVTASELARILIGRQGRTIESVQPPRRPSPQGKNCVAVRP